MSDLDKQVAEALGCESVGEIDGKCWVGDVDTKYWGYFSPSTNWSQGGPLIEAYDISVIGSKLEGWQGLMHSTDDRPIIQEYGETYLIAAMKALVASTKE